MSNFRKYGTIAAIALVAAYGIGLVTGPSISTEIEIAAPTADVWRELTNGAAYPDWNPFVKHLSGDLTVGNHINVTIQPEGSSPMDFTPEILAAEQNTELRWIGKLGFKGIFDGEHFFILKQTAEGKTILQHGENFTGVLAYPLIGLIGEGTRNGFEAMNRALKARVESEG